MSEPAKTPFDLLLDQIRAVVREEIKSANGAGGKNDKLLNPEETAKLLSVSEDWLYHNAKSLPFHSEIRTAIITLQLSRNDKVDGIQKVWQGVKRRQNR